MTDVRIYHSNDGGEIDYVNGSAVTDSGLESAAYLSMFGGNEDDSGDSSDDRNQWWGNVAENDPERRYRSETAYLLRNIPAIPANMPRIEEAVLRDIAWMESALEASIAARVTIPALNTVRIEINIELGETTATIVIVESWGALT